MSFCYSLNAGETRGGRGKLSPTRSLSPGEVKYKSDGDPELILPYLFWLVSIMNTTLPCSVRDY